MEKVFIISILITIFYCAYRFIEMKFIDKQLKPLKIIVRDAIIVFLCSMLACYMFFYLESYITGFFNVITDSKTINPATTQIFTDDPGF